MERLLDLALLTEQEDEVEDMVSDILDAAEETPIAMGEKEEEEEEEEEAKPKAIKISAEREDKIKQEMTSALLREKIQKDKSEHEQLQNQLERSLIKRMTGKDLIRVRGLGWFDRDAFKKGEVEKVPVTKEILDEVDKITSRAMLNYWACDYGVGRKDRWVEFDTRKPLTTDSLIKLSTEFSQAKETDMSFSDFLEEEGYEEEEIQWQDSKPYEAGEAFINLMKVRIDKARARIKIILDQAKAAGIPAEAVLHTPPVLRAAKGRVRPGVKGGVSQVMSRAEYFTQFEKGIKKRRTLPDVYEKEFGGKLNYYRRPARYWEGIILSAHNMIAKVRATIGERREGAEGYDMGDWKVPPFQEPKKKKIGNEIVYDPRVGRDQAAWKRALIFARGIAQEAPPATADEPSIKASWMFDKNKIRPEAFKYLMWLTMNALVGYSSYQKMKDVEKVFTPSQTQKYWERVRRESIESPDDIILEVRLPKEVTHGRL